MGVETIVRATEDRQMATPLTNFLRCEAEGQHIIVVLLLQAKIQNSELLNVEQAL
jgi:hypothetical protein